MMLPRGTPAWGEGWKAAVRKHYRHSAHRDSRQCDVYRDRYLSLDADLHQRARLTLLPFTFDGTTTEPGWRPTTAAKIEEIVHAMKPEKQATMLIRSGDHTMFGLSIHASDRGAIMGRIPATALIKPILAKLAPAEPVRLRRPLPFRRTSWRSDGTARAALGVFLQPEDQGDLNLKISGPAGAGMRSNHACCWGTIEPNDRATVGCVDCRTEASGSDSPDRNQHGRLLLRASLRGNGILFPYPFAAV